MGTLLIVSSEIYRKVEWWKCRLCSLWAHANRSKLSKNWGRGDKQILEATISLVFTSTHSRLLNAFCTRKTHIYTHRKRNFIVENWKFAPMNQPCSVLKEWKDNLLNSLHQIKFSCVFSPPAQPVEVLVRETWKMGLTNPVVVVDWGVLRRLCYVSSVRLALERVILMSLLICDVFSALILHPSLPLAIFSHLYLRFVFILWQQ